MSHSECYTPVSLLDLSNPHEKSKTLKRKLRSQEKREGLWRTAELWLVARRLQPPTDRLFRLFLITEPHPIIQLATGWAVNSQAYQYKLETRNFLNLRKGARQVWLLDVLISPIVISSPGDHEVWSKHWKGAANQSLMTYSLFRRLS